MAVYNFKREAQVHLVYYGASPATVKNYPASSKLVHHFTLNNISDGILDSKGSISSGTTSGIGHTTVDSPAGLGVVSTRTNGIQVLTATEANSWEDENDEWSLSIWFKSTIASASGYTQERIVSRDLSESFGVRLNQAAASGAQGLTLYGEPSSTNIVNNINTNQWYHLVLTSNGTRLKAYLDGVEKVSSVAYTRTSEAAGLVLGQNSEIGGIQVSPGITGELSDLRLFNRELSSAEILALYKNYIEPTEGVQVKLEVTPDLTFGQTFTDDSTSVKTLHQQVFFERASITKANPANFTFSIPIFKEDDLQIVHDRLLDCKTFDLYISTQQDVFKLEKSVITNGTYEIERSTPLTLTVSGQASKLSKVGAFGSYTVPGTVQSSTSNRKYLQTAKVDIDLDSVDISSEIFSISAELQNDIAWNNNSSVQKGISATNRTNAIFPERFTIEKKVFSGSIGRYLCDDNASDVNNFDASTPIRIQIGEEISGVLYGFDFNMPSCSFTNRSAVGEIFTQNYDWRLTSNQALTTTITYNNI
jgi:hypothetical protein